MALEFMDPPAKGKRGFFYWRVAEELRQHPGESALAFKEERASLANAIRGGKIAALKPSLGFSVTTRNNHKDDEGFRVCDIYVTYDPESDTERSQK